MKLLLDQGLPRSAVHHLAALGIDAVHVGELGMAAATDAEIIAEAIQQQAIVVTLDADFHSLLADSGATQPSVIRIRIQGVKGDALSRLLAQVMAKIANELNAGAAVTITRSATRVHLLPIP